jgi:membrane-bound lytic murein transglycosylase D
MVRRSALPRAFLAGTAFVAAACGASVHTNAPAAVPVPPIPVSQPQFTTLPRPALDPVLALIGQSDEFFQSGQTELERGHMAAARREFDRALGVLMESPYGGRTEPRIREHFDRLVDRISAYEVKALADGDGFTEKQYEPASIDELLAMSATLAPPDSATKDAVESDTVQHDIPIPLNLRVLAFIELFQGRLHDFIEEGLQRGARYLPMIQSVFRAEGLPLDLAYIPLVESAFKPNALSRAKAKGVWQFMRGTGAENGLRQDWYIDERSDPEKATTAAAKYLNTLAKMFDGDWHLALASYNGGPGRVQRALKRGNLKDFWALAARPSLLPRETRDYVPMILAAIVIAKNPLQYGFNPEPLPTATYETVSLERPVDIRRVAEWLEMPVDDIQALNPELRRWTTPLRDEAYGLKVPQGKADVIKARLEGSTPIDLAALRWYTVKSGETLPGIARKLSVSRADLAQANYLKPTSPVEPGQQLIVPHEASILMASNTDRPVPAADSRRLAADTVVNAPSGDRVKVVYQVKSGDTLASIARLFETTVASLRTWNRLPTSRIEAGTRLTIYTARAN